MFRNFAGTAATYAASRFFYSYLRNRAEEARNQTQTEMIPKLAPNPAPRQKIYGIRLSGFYYAEPESGPRI